MANSQPPPPPPVGEDNWIDYVNQQRRSADSLEKHIHIVELYRTAASAETGSIKLWLAYCDYFWSLYQDCQLNSHAHWAPDEQATAREIFTLDAALHLWSEGHDATKYRLSDSHDLWNRWIGLEKDLLDKTRTAEGVKRITHLYRNRLLTPHRTWDETSQMFSSFLSEYNPNGYEEAMADVTDRAKAAKRFSNQRDRFETPLQKAASSGDVDAQKTVMADYLVWEIANTKKDRKNQLAAIQLGLGLFSRALTGFLASDEATWTDFTVYVSHLRTVFGEGSQKKDGHDDILAILPNSIDVLQRSVQHCPWSGALWARYILSGEEAKLAFSDMERIKHAATNSSQLDRDGMTAVVDMYAAWCGYLKRTAMHSNATDDAVDIADSGLLAALEAVQVWGERRFGDAYQGDPNFRLERILIQYLTEKHSAIDQARGQWQKLSTRELYNNSYDFWLTYFMWEMLVFQAQKGAGRSPTPGAPTKGLRVPTLAAQVLEKAVHNRNMDWPERVMEVYLHHCNDYQTSDTLRRALNTVHKVKQGVARRRADEAAQAAVAYAAQAQIQQVAPQANEQDAFGSPSGSKRKREATPDGQGNEHKRLKNEAPGGSQNPEQDTHKRDRENTTIFVTNLPSDVTATRVKAYFKEFGHIVNHTVREENDGTSAIAFVEFRSPEDVQSALIRDGKYFGDRQIAIKPGTNLTIYVTNFPPTADEEYIRNLFKDCGEIFSIRWPSLKFNTRRRFCYVTFRDGEAATKAVKLHESVLEGRYKLTAVFSNPGMKKSRDGATAEGREIHIKGLDQGVDESTLRDVCAKYGTVTTIRILRNMKGKSRGTAFAVYEKKEGADEAVEQLDKTKFGSQILTVEISVPSTYNPSTRAVGVASPSPAPSSRDGEGDEVVPDHIPVENGARSDEAPNERSFALMGIPDTVNIERVRAMVEPHGKLVKLVLRADHGGALIELSDAAAVGKAQLALEGREVDGGTLWTGSVADLFKEKPGKKSRQSKKASVSVAGLTKAQANASAAALMPPPPRVSRPTAKVGGPKRGLGYVSKGSGEGKANGSTEATGASSATKKSNADFRSLFLAESSKNGTASKDSNTADAGSSQNGDTGA